MATQKTQRKKKPAKLQTLKAPKVVTTQTKSNLPNGFPLEHYSYSCFSSFCQNPLMFKVNYVNGDRIESAHSVSSVLGQVCHKGMRGYLSALADGFPEEAAIKQGYDEAEEHLDSISDGFIEYNKTIDTRAKLHEHVSNAYFGYVREYNYHNKVKESLLIDEKIRHKIKIDGKVLPVPLKGYADFVYRDHEDRIIIEDHKFSFRYSNEDEVDGLKLIQAAFYYLLVSAEIGEPPHALMFREYKLSKNRDGSQQTKEFMIEYGKHPLIFDLFYRLYNDVTDALLGKQVFVPNIMAMFDKEVALLAYIHHLDEPEERARKLQNEKVDNITDFLKKKIQNDGAMKRYMDTISQKFVSGKSLNYKDMTPEEKIKMKLAEHGMPVDHDSTVEGGSVTLYRFEPQIGLKMSKLEGYKKDIEQVLAKSNVRILAPIPNTDLIGFEVPKDERVFPDTQPKPNNFELMIGEDVMGGIVYHDIRTAPHMLVAGATGSGKSMFLNALVYQLNSLPKKDSQLVLIDPKMVELGHFMHEKNVVGYYEQIEEIHGALEQEVTEMSNRYKKLRQAGARNIEEYREQGHKMPYRFIFVDEFGDIVMQDYIRKEEYETGEYYQQGPNAGQPKMKVEKRNLSQEVMQNILLLAQKARSAGIHVVLSTQRPSVDVVTGTIKANFPTKVAFRTSKAIDSQVILDEAGAESLLGKGDMIFDSEEGRRRLQGLKV